MRDPEHEWLDLLPKIELHLHLEGAIPIRALWNLLQKYGGDPEVRDIDSLNRRFAYRDFPHFIETWIWKNGFLREYEDFSFLAEAVALDLAEQNIRYVEAHYSPSDFSAHGLVTGRLTEAVRVGLGRVPEIEVALIADLVRDCPIERASRTLEEVREVMELGVIGVGLGGSEQQFPPEPFAPLFERARSFGLHTTAHAGEAAGAGSIWGALNSLGAERVGHATRAFEDPRLLEYLAERQVPLEMCPLSNVRTGVVAGIEAHPIRECFDRGMLVTVNTDDPKMFNNSLAEEYGLLMNCLGFTREEILTLVGNAIRASWLPADRKRALADELS
jgi:adenosine deaminase